MREVPILLSSCILSLTAAAQSAWYVDPATCDGAGDGTATAPFCTIQEALDVAADGDKLVLAPGIHTGQIVVPPIEVAIVGAAGAEFTHLQSAVPPLMDVTPGAHLVLREITVSPTASPAPRGRFSTPGIHVRAAAAEIERCRFVDMQGRTGGAVLAEESALVVRDSAFVRTRADFGGAVAALGGTLRVEGCRFEETEGPPDAGAGGALWTRGTAVTVAASLFRGCRAFDHGGAIAVDGGSLALERSAFLHNFVTRYAGTVAVTDAEVTIRACIFADNEACEGWGGAVFADAGEEARIVLEDLRFERNLAAEGGAVCIRSGQAEVAGCSFVENTAYQRFSYPELGYGGGLFVAGAPGAPLGTAHARVTRCTFLKNGARGNVVRNPGKGGAVFGNVTLESCTLYASAAARSELVAEPPSAGAAAGTVTLANCIVWQSQPDALEAGTQASWSLVQGSWPGEGNLSRDPGLVDPSRGDLHLLPSSPCVDRGDPSLQDRDGTRLDIGALPYDPLHAMFARRGGQTP